jgi:hypothetical protein
MTTWLPSGLVCNQAHRAARVMSGQHSDAEPLVPSPRIAVSGLTFPSREESVSLVESASRVVPVSNRQRHGGGPLGARPVENRSHQRLAQTATSRRGLHPHGIQLAFSITAGHGDAGNKPPRLTAVHRNEPNLVPQDSRQKPSGLPCSASRVDPKQSGSASSARRRSVRSSSHCSTTRRSTRFTRSCSSRPLAVHHALILPDQDPHNLSESSACGTRTPSTRQISSLDARSQRT